MSEEKNIAKPKKPGLKPSAIAFILCSLMLASAFLPTTILLFVGMLPTLVAFYIDRGSRKAKAMTVGAMNFAGCSPFLFQLWQQGHTYETSLKIIFDPTTISLMYVAAAVGYALDWALCGVVASFLQQKALVQQNHIRDRQKELVERWGKEVTGDFVLDEAGFIKQREEKK